MRIKTEVPPSHVVRTILDTKVQCDVYLISERSRPLDGYFEGTDGSYVLRAVFVYLPDLAARTGWFHDRLSGVKIGTSTLLLPFASEDELRDDVVLRECVHQYWADRYGPFDGSRARLEVEESSSFYAVIAYGKKPQHALVTELAREQSALKDRASLRPAHELLDLFGKSSPAAITRYDDMPEMSILPEDEVLRSYAVKQLKFLLK